MSSEALAKEDTLRQVPPKTQKGPRLLAVGLHIQRTRHQSRPADERTPYLPSFSEEVGSSPSTPRRWMVPAGAGIRPRVGVCG